MTPLQQLKQKKLEEFKKIRTDAISEMFDNVDEHGVYPTTKFFEKLDSTLSSAMDEIQNATIEAAQGEIDGLKKPEIEIEPCENCGEEGYGKCWYGMGRETHDAWGDRYTPTGSVVFCKECFNQFYIGKDWNGEKIWKRTSTLPEHEQGRINHITIRPNIKHNAALSKSHSALNNLKTK